jgi:REP element-mobilizing transposase RayT
MGGHKIHDQTGLYFHTFTLVGWGDVFSRKDYREIMIENLKFCIREKGLILFAYVIMSNHVHLIARTDSEKGLSSIIRDLKKYTSKKIIQAIGQNKQESRKEWMLNIFDEAGENNKRNTEYQFWKQDNKPVELNSPKWIHQKLDYIHLNPVVAGIVKEPEHYLYSSARNYLEMPGLIDVEILDFRTSEGDGFVALSS